MKKKKTKKKLSNIVNRKVPKNKIGQKKRILKSITNPKNIGTQKEKKNILTRNEDEN